MVQWMDRDTRRFTQMGGEGASWLGEAPFSTRPHIFQNVGDGTFYHSGSLAIRAAKASGANITFKILYNDAVAMTGGQKMETGNLDVPAITRLLEAEGVQEIAVVTDEPGKYPLGAAFAPGVRVHHRDELDAVQRRLREVPGVSALVYDQTCAAEKRRRRKRGAFPDPDERVVINELVCEGCGDCGVASNCVAIQPVGDRVRPQAADRPVGLQQGLQLPQGLLPELRHRQGRQAAQGRGARRRAVPGPARARAARARRSLRHPGHRRRRHRRDHHRGAARHGGPSRGQGRRRARHDRHGPEGRRGPHPPEDRARRQDEIGAPARRGRRRRGWSWAATSSSPPAPRRCRPCAGASPRAVVNLEAVDDRRLHPRPRPRLPGRAAAAGDRRRGRRRPGRASSTPAGSPPPSSATPSAPTCSWSATLGRRA